MNLLTLTHYPSEKGLGEETRYQLNLLLMKELIAILYNILEEDKVQEGQRYKDVELIDRTLQDLGYSVERIAVGKDISEPVLCLKNTSPKYVFNLCEEVDNDSWGEIYVAGILELLRIPYTGSNPFCLALSLNKAKAKDVLRSQGIAVPGYQVFTSGETIIREDLAFPLIIKPLCEDGSFGIDPGSVVRDKEAFYEKLEARRREFNGPLIAEEYIEGRELNVSILGNAEKLRVLPVSEIDYSSMPQGAARICSFRAKWEKESAEYKGTVPVCPAHISEGLKRNLEDVGVRVYRIMGCSDYARVDIRLRKEGEIPYVIDVNPNPCISPDSGFVRSARAGGLDYKDFIKAILASCQERYRNGAQIGGSRITARR